MMKKMARSFLANTKIKLVSVVIQFTVKRDCVINICHLDSQALQLSVFHHLTPPYLSIFIVENYKM